MNAQIHKFIDEQLRQWELARRNYDALSQVESRDIDVKGTLYKVQFNPARILSSGAKVDKQSIQERPCFLCAHNQPNEQQEILFGNHYRILVNPFPIFPRHLTIPEIEHTPQTIKERFDDMLELTRTLTDFVIFYNGACCGASAPDHAHVQAGNKGFLPLETNFSSFELDTVTTLRGATLSSIKYDIRGTFVLRGDILADIRRLFDTLYQELTINPHDEPMMNIVAWYNSGQWTVCVFPRSKHRPACFFAKGEENLLISPASVDIAGVFITPQEKDFHKITAKDIDRILREVSISPDEQQKLKERLTKRLLHL